MFYASIHIDLPSEERLRRRTALEWLAGLIGREPDLRSGEEISTVTGLSVFKRIADALEQLGITDVLSVTVDRKAAYVDTEESSGDLATAVAELDARRVLEKPIETMDLALSHRAEDLHTLIDVRLRRRVPAGSPELELAFAARLDAMQVRRGENPAEYAARLRFLAGDGEQLAAARERFTALTRAAKAAIEEQLGELVLASILGPVTLRLIRPGPRALDHFRRLTWGPSVRMPRYRPVPIRNRKGAYDEPFYHYYFDPYFDFVAWITLEELVAGRGWTNLKYEVVDADGERAFTHEDARGQAAIAGDYSSAGQHLKAPVRLEGAALIIDPAVPRFEGLDPGEVADPRVVIGYGGDGRVDEGAVGADWNDGGDIGGVEVGCGAACGGVEG